MNIFRWVAAVVFFLELPTPIFWLVVHPQRRFWRGRLRAAYITAVAAAWGTAAICLIAFRRAIFAQAQPGDFRIGSGLLLIATGIWLFGRAKRDLGTARFVGKTELLGEGEVIDTGIYSCLRNPRYVGMMASICGACTLAATISMWEAAGVWFVLVLIMIEFEERELRARLGAPYIEYCRRVSRFVPYRILRRTK